MQDARKRRAFACCFATVVALGVYGWIQNSVLFPRFAEFFPVGREIDTAVRAALYIAVAVVASRKPNLLDARTISATSIVAVASATALLYAAVSMESNGLAILGIVFFEIGHIWIVVMYGLALCLLATPRHSALAVAFGTVAGDIIQGIVGVFPLEVGMAAMAGLPLVALALSYAPAARFLSMLQSEAAPSELEIANPRSFLAPTNALFACILVFSAASGYALTLNEVDNAPNSSPAEWMGTLAVALLMMSRRKPGGEDMLFSLSALLVIAGFLAAPLTFGTDDAGANALLRIGKNCFDVLVWMTVASIGKQNPFSLLIALGIANAARSIGTIAGAIAGHTVNDFAPVAEPFAHTITACALFAFVAFLWLGFRNFSFERTIRGLEMPQTAQQNDDREDVFDKRCFTIARDRGLTERETEIFLFMAHGRNVGFIEEHFVISRNTVKTHVKRIYKKLDVHSQQELIDLAESEPR
ncbi:MAG: helix-turn-helix transcriptional regulator [Slackia sp.]|nr:helix-turn-helix transcriptional regulator [Slackia sp.]